MCLIEDGILKGYIQDAMNARLMGVKPTGNGRRESYAHVPMPRMTNTYMLGGDKSPEEIVASLEKGFVRRELWWRVKSTSPQASLCSLRRKRIGWRTARFNTLSKAPPWWATALMR